MCGIAGVWFKDSASHRAERIRNAFKEAVNVMKHRGPDVQQVWSDSKMLLGHTRLSILDLSSAANQPFVAETGEVLVFNGEIFNHSDLRQQQIVDGVSHSTRSDTEVLLTHLKLSGPQHELLNGFFAYGFYQPTANKVTVARDRMGIKPLYYFFDGDVFIFASELGVISSLLDEKSVNREGLYWYMRLGYVPAPLSMLDKVYKVMPGETLILENGNFKKERYFEPQLADKLIADIDVASSLLYDTLADSVRLRLEADVPVGSFLSGGVDSSIIAAIGASFRQDLKTFSISFPDLKFLDEAPLARLTADYLKTNHHEIPILFSDVVASVPQYLEHLGEPFADSSGLAVHVLSREVKSHVTVALSGDGADELFAGYNKHAAWLRLQQPGIKERMVLMTSFFWKAFPASREGYFQNKVRQMTRFAQSFKLNGIDRYLFLASITAQNKAIFATGFTPENEIPGTLQGINISDVNSVLIADQRLVLPNDMLFKVDHASMTHALEVRVPFLDYRVVALANGIGCHLKIHKGQRKRILKQAFSNILPDEVFQRRKRGFEVPLLSWLTGPMREKMMDTVFNESNKSLHEYIRREYLMDLKMRLFSNSPGNSAQEAWACYVFDDWLKKLL